jgi:hypothetical protein
MSDSRQDPGTSVTGEQFVAGVKRELDQSCRALDGQTLSRLNSIRHAALEQRRGRKPKAFLLPFGGLVTASVLVLSVSLLNNGGAPGLQNPAVDSPLEDIEILTSADSLDFYEDYEFYQWLAENDPSV